MINSIVVGIRMALIEMRSHYVRSLLSMLGVLLGVASLVAMLTLIGGMDVFFHERIGSWAGAVMFTPKAASRHNATAAWSRSPGMRLSDGEYLQENSPSVQHFHAAIERRGTARILGHSETIRLRGLAPSTMNDELKDVYLAQGRNFSAAEIDKGAPVCIITWEIEDRIRTTQRGTADLLGSSLLFNSITFTVVGVLKPQDPLYKPWHLRGTVIVPLNSIKNMITGTDPNPGSLRVSVSEPKRIREEAVQAAMVLKERHRGVEDFEYQTTEWIHEVTRMLGNAGILMSVVAAISLLVGGLSIMNVMLSSISERIHEIGIRKALGARNSQIFVQFLAETLTLCCTGGIIGSVLGSIPVVFREVIKRSTQGAIEPTIVPVHVLWVAVTVVAVGIAFGLYPALRAFRMDPVDALRYE